MSLDAIVSHIKQHPGRTATQIANALFGVRGYHERVGYTLKILCSAGRVERRGCGGPGDPFKYYLSNNEPAELI